MPRFHFHTLDQTEVRDEEGYDFDSVAMARTAAVIYASEVLKELGGAIYDTDLRVTVMDANGLILWDIMVVATEAPAVASQALKTAQG